MRSSLLLDAASLALVACSSGSSPSSPSGSPPAPTSTVTLHVANGTTLTVVLFVNGQHVADFPSGGPTPTIDPASLPPLPWSVEARSPTGRILTSMAVRPGDVSSITDPGGGIRSTTPFGRVDLSCGRLTIWAGDVPVIGPVPPSPAGSRGDCAP